MQNKALNIAVALILIVGIGGLVYYKKQESVSVPASPAGGTYESGSPESGLSDTPESIPSSGITLTQVAQHNSRTSCWAVISGSVYDLTSWIPNHPGGEQAILSLCGKDGTATFNGQHGNNLKAKSVLAGFKIGILSQ